MHNLNVGNESEQMAHEGNFWLRYKTFNLRDLALHIGSLSCEMVFFSSEFQHLFALAHRRAQKSQAVYIIIVVLYIMSVSVYVLCM